MNIERIFKSIIIIFILISVIGFLIEIYYFKTSLPISSFAIILGLLILVIFDFYTRIQHNIDKINKSVNKNQEMLNIKSDFDFKLLNFKYDLEKKIRQACK